MSKQAVQALIERMKTDEALRARVLAVADLDERLVLVRAEGFELTEEELRAEAAELSDEHLAHAVGGIVVAAPRMDSCSGYVGC